MESANNNSNQLVFLSEFKELRNELSAVKKRIVELEESNEKQQERIDNLERENHALKTQLNNLNGNKAGESALKRKRPEKNHEKENTESNSTSVSAGKKKTKTNNNNDNDDEAVVISRYDNGDSFDSLSDDLLHKIVEFDGNCYEKFGLINKRCKNIYDMKEYKLKKKTYVYGYGGLDMILERYLQKRKVGILIEYDLSKAVVWYNRLDAIDWMIQLGDIKLVQEVCFEAACFGRIDILAKVFCKCNLTMLDQILYDVDGLLCYLAACNGKLDTLKWLRKYDAKLHVDTFAIASLNGHDEMVQYLRAEGCPEPDPLEY